MDLSYTSIMRYLIVIICVSLAGCEALQNRPDPSPAERARQADIDAKAAAGLEMMRGAGAHRPPSGSSSVSCQDWGNGRITCR